MMYTPNFNDPRVIRRIKKSIGFTAALTSADKPRQLSTRFIDKHFGSQRNELSKFLRNQLLLCIDDTYDMERKTCKKYITNETGLSNLLDFLDKKNGNKTYHITYPSVVDLSKAAIEWANETYKEELDTLKFQYTEKKHRLYNEIQNIRSDARAELLAERGLCYNYDIDTAAPTLLYQHSFKTPSATGEVCETIEYYIQNKELVRNRLAEQTGLPVNNIKKIINAMFSGGFLTTYKRSVVFQMCNNDVAIVKYLQQNPFIVALKEDIKTMWAPIKADTPAQYYWTKSGKYRKRPFDPRTKWNIYFDLERRVINQVIQYINEIGANKFLEHDGFRTDKAINVVDLSLYIEAGIGYKVNFKEEVYDANRN